MTGTMHIQGAKALSRQDALKAIKGLVSDELCREGGLRFIPLTPTAPSPDAKLGLGPDTYIPLEGSLNQSDALSVADRGEEMLRAREALEAKRPSGLRRVLQRLNNKFEVTGG